MAQTPILDEFLGSLTEIVQSGDGAKLQDFLQIEPPLPEIYQHMIEELRRRYPPGSQSDTNLQRRCESLILKTKSDPKHTKDISSWTAFPTFIRHYFSFLRDVNVENLLETWKLLRALLNQCVLALSDSNHGVIILPTVLYLSKVLAKLAIGLDRRPDLIAHILRQKSGENQGEAMEQVTLVEQSANVMREAFIKCLTDRNASNVRNVKPEGKRTAIYLMANICLKLFFKCGKLRNAEQMFASITAQSPPLMYYPASQRVAYLYYLGRYLFSNNLFHPARIALQAAYDQCHREALSQRKLILTYLIPCNIIMGRFPSKALLQRPEGQELTQHFEPLCRLIIRGDYLAFRRHLSFDSPAAEWFSRKGLLLVLRNRCEILVWRSLCRKVFIHAGFEGKDKVPPYFFLSKLAFATKWLQSRSPQPLSMNGATSTFSQPSYGSQTISEPTDPDFAGLGTQGANSDHYEDIMEKYGDYLAPAGFFDEGGFWQKNTPGQLVDALPEADYEDSQLDPYADDNIFNEQPALLMDEIESIIASLVTQGLMHGYLTHQNPRFAIMGARHRGALPAGFPNVWETISKRESEDNNVPGWVKPTTTAGAAGGGRVVQFFGARPAGA